MALVSVRSKFQIALPKEVREAAGVEVGDLLEARVESGKITFTPQSALDRGLAESLADFESGRSFGPFGSARDLANSLHKESAKLRSKPRPRRKPRK